MEIDCSSIICSIVKILNSNNFSLLKNLHSTADIQLFHQKSPLCLAVSVSIAEYTIFFRNIHSFVLLLIEFDIQREECCVRRTRDAG